MTVYRIVFTVMAAALFVAASARCVVIDVKAVDGDATAVLQDAVDEAARQRDGDTVVIRLQPGAVYNISRRESTTRLYHVSNTTSVSENPVPVKHIGLLMQGLRNVSFDGRGATLLTHGEMTPWVMDGCTGVTLTDLTVDAADPSVPEMTVTECDSRRLTARVHERSRYVLQDGRLYWQGEGWGVPVFGI